MTGDITPCCSGGQCETLFQCMFSMGISAGSCGGFLSVCCVKPQTINRCF